MTSIMSRTIIALAALAAVVAIVWMLFHRPANSCDTIFEQATASFGAKLEFIKARGEVLIGKQSVQDLTERAQLSALNLKTCCIVFEGGKLNAAEFLNCKQSIEQQNAHVERIVTVIREAAVAQEKSQPDVVRQKVAQAAQIIDEVKVSADGLDKQVARIKAAATAQPAAAPAPARPPPPRTEERGAVTGTEHEPNNDAFQANSVKLGATISGTIDDNADADWFVFRGDNKVRDLVNIRIINRSVTLEPYIALYDADKNRTVEAAAGVGANVDFTVSVQPGKEYFVEVRSHYRNKAGAYELAIKPLEAYDEFEPNEDAFSARPITVGKTIEANIMDGADNDWYLVKGFPGATLTVRLENGSTTLEPYLAVYDSDKNRIDEAARGAGANLELAVKAQPGKDYYIEVRSHYRNNAGKYRLAVKSSG